MSVDPTRSSFLGHCRWCGAEVNTDSFRDLQGLRAYYEEASCQRCRDVQSLGADEGDPSVSYPVRHGVVVSAICEDDCVLELAFLPFLFVVPSGRIVWEPRHIVRAGQVIDPVNPWVDLDAMAEAWREHYVRVLCVPWFTDPLLRGGLAGRDFVIGLDRTPLRVVGDLVPDARWPALVSLSAEIPWQDGFGLPLLPLESFLRVHAPDLDLGPADARCGSSLRQCAIVARVLSLPATRGRDAGRTTFELLLRGHEARFEESFRGRSRDAS